MLPRHAKARQETVAGDRRRAPRLQVRRARHLWGAGAGPTGTRHGGDPGGIW